MSKTHRGEERSKAENPVRGNVPPYQVAFVATIEGVDLSERDKRVIRRMFTKNLPAEKPLSSNAIQRLQLELHKAEEDLRSPGVTSADFERYDALRARYWNATIRKR